MSKSTVATNTALIAALTDRIDALEHTLIYNGIATSAHLNRTGEVIDFLTNWGINTEAMASVDAGLLALTQLNFCTIGNWHHLRFSARFYRDHREWCGKFFAKLNTNARAKGHGAKHLKKEQGSWFIIAVEPREGVCTGDDPTIGDIPM